MSEMSEHKPCKLVEGLIVSSNITVIEKMRRRIPPMDMVQEAPKMQGTPCNTLTLTTNFVLEGKKLKEKQRSIVVT